MLRAIDEAEDDLLFRRFDECLVKCEDGITRVKTDAAPAEKQQYLVHLSMIAVQAFAELDRWQDVLPYVTSIFDGIEDCPGKIVKICLLLYSHVHDFNTCTAIAHIWLRKESNFADSEYTNIVIIFITKVLVPQEKWDSIPAFVSSCAGLESSQQQQILDDIQVLKETLAGQKLLLLEQERKEAEAKEKLKQQEASTTTDPVRKLLGSLKGILKQHPAVAASLAFGNISIMLFIFYLVYLKSKAREGVLKEQIYKVWKVIVNLWKSMFSPYYQSR